MEEYELSEEFLKDGPEPERQRGDGYRWPVALPDQTRPILYSGARYKIQYRLETQRRHREAAMVFMGIRVNMGKILSVWSARPLAGTQELPVNAVSILEPIPFGTKPYLDRIASNG